MKKVIYKYGLHITDEQLIPMPIGAEILTAQIQNGDPQLWALCDPLQELETRRIRVLGAGNSVSDDEKITMKYISTIQLYEGRLVFHVFESVNV
jgi:hypothetical protein